MSRAGTCRIEIVHKIQTVPFVTISAFTHTHPQSLSLRARLYSSHWRVPLHTPLPTHKIQFMALAKASAPIGRAHGTEKKKKITKCASTTNIATLSPRPIIVLSLVFMATLEPGFQWQNTALSSHNAQTVRFIFREANILHECPWLIVAWRLVTRMTCYSVNCFRFCTSRQKKKVATNECE